MRCAQSNLNASGGLTFLLPINAALVAFENSLPPAMKQVGIKAADHGFFFAMWRLDCAACSHRREWLHLQVFLSSPPVIASLIAYNTLSVLVK